MDVELDQNFALCGNPKVTGDQEYVSMEPAFAWKDECWSEELKNTLLGAPTEIFWEQLSQEDIEALLGKGEEAGEFQSPDEAATTSAAEDFYAFPLVQDAPMPIMGMAEDLLDEQESWEAAVNQGDGEQKMEEECLEELYDGDYGATAQIGQDRDYLFSLPISSYLDENFDESLFDQVEADSGEEQEDVDDVGSGGEDSPKEGTSSKMQMTVLTGCQEDASFDSGLGEERFEGCVSPLPESMERQEDKAMLAKKSNDDKKQETVFCTRTISCGK